MATKKKAQGKKVEDYRHEEAKRLNNPPAGLAWQDTEKPAKRRFEYDPHLDPQLVWAGKAERQSFEVEAPSIHVHERLSADDILRSVTKAPMQPALFDYEELDRSKLIDFYRHELGWENRLILGDSLVAMTSLLEKERLGSQIQMIYIDPPYGVNFNSNFQARLSNRSPRETVDDSLTREPEQIQAYRDTWELGIHSYLTYLRDRLVLAHELLSESGSVFVQIGDENEHRVRTLMDEVYGADNYAATIVALKTSGATAKYLPQIADYVLWYAKNLLVMKYRQLYTTKAPAGEGGAYTHIELSDGSRRPMTDEERRDQSKLPTGARPYRRSDLTSQAPRLSNRQPVEFGGKLYRPYPGGWKTNESGLARLIERGRVEPSGGRLNYVRFYDDFLGQPYTNVWTDTVRSGFAGKKRYVVETTPKLISRCLLMTTDPGDLVLDPTCGSGTTALVAEEYGRRWITCDTSRVAVALTRERLATALFPYYKLVDSSRGIDAGLEYKRLTRVTLRSLAHDLEPEEVVLFDQPVTDQARARVSGPFTSEALSRYAVNPLQDGVPPAPADPKEGDADDHVRTLLDALAKQGIPRKAAQPAKVVRIEPTTGSAVLHAQGFYKADDDSEKSFAASVGPRFGPVTVGQIDDALHEAYGYDLVVFAGFAATAEAQEYVKAGRLGKFNVALLEANPDLLVGDLLKHTSSSQTFRLFAAPDVKLNTKDGGNRTVEVLGVDLFDAATGETKFVGDEYVAAWFLDTDYDGLVFHVTQAFFPNGGWEKLAKTLKGTVDEELMEQLERFESLPFETGEHKKVAVRVVDDAGTTSEVVLDLE